MLSPDSTPCARSIVLQSFRPYAAFSERRQVVTMNLKKAVNHSDWARLSDKPRAWWMGDAHEFSECGGMSPKRGVRRRRTSLATASRLSAAESASRVCRADIPLVSPLGAFGLLDGMGASLFSQPARLTDTFAAQQIWSSRGIFYTIGLFPVQQKTVRHDGGAP